MGGLRPMSTRLLRIDPALGDRALHEALAEPARVLRAGGLVAVPTETVYGLAANALDADAVARIFEAKGRPLYDPVIVHVADADELDRVAAEVPPLARDLCARFWPGPLTLVLPRGDDVPEIVAAGGPTVAVRCPAHPVARALIRAAGVPVAAPSANRFGHTSPTEAQHVLDDLAGRVDLVVDGGPCEVGVESTVLDLTSDPPAVLRPGGVPIEALAGAVPGVVERRQAAPPSADLPSPGLLERHYAPRTPLWLVEGGVDRLVALAAAQRAAGVHVAVLVADEDLAAARAASLEATALGPAAGAEGVARALFRELRRLEDAGFDLLLVRSFPREGLGAAVHDRLTRAADRVIRLG